MNQAVEALKTGSPALIQNILNILPGLFLAAALTLAAVFVSEGAGLLMGLDKSPVSVVMAAIVIGILLKNSIGVHERFAPGIAFCLKTILRLGIVLMGIRLSILAVLKIGALSVGIVIACIVTGIALTLLITKKLNLSRRLGLLIGIGTGICGATAIVAASPVIGAEEEETAYAVATVTVFGIVVMFAYPYLVNILFSGNHLQSGLFLGTAIHETAQVAGAGLMYDQVWNVVKAPGATTGADAAIITKLVRNVFIAAAIPAAAVLYHRQDGSGEGRKINILSYLPLFILGFLFMAIVRTAGDYLIVDRGLFWNGASWKALYGNVKAGAEFLLAVAMAGVGLGTDLKKLARLGLRPFAAGLCAAATVGLIAFLLIRFAVG